MGVKPQDVVHAINCGSKYSHKEQYTGIEYSADKYFDGGVMSDEGYNHQWPLPNSEVYQTERWGKEPFKYQIPVSDGKFTLVLKFSETYFQQPGGKVFDVKLGEHFLG